jgi:hypothetical protein
VAARNEEGKHHHAVVGIDKSLRNKAPFAPRLAQQGGVGTHALTPPKYLFALGIVNGQVKLESLVGVIAEGAVQRLGVWAKHAGHRLGQIADDLHILPRHRLLLEPHGSK